VPTFAEYETYGEPLVVTDERRYVVTVWQARKSGGEPRLYIIKCYAPRVSPSLPGQETEALAKDQGLEFLEGIKQIKKAQSEGGSNLAPIYALGKTESEAWYVTDHYPRNNLKAWVSRRGGVDSDALRHVVQSVVAGCLALKRSRGYSHGNLKPSNVFLVGQPRPLKKTPLVLTDAYPAAPLQLAALGPGDRKEASELLTEVIEAQDLRNLGELILQLVEGRLFARSDDYNYPVAHSGIWDILGKDADFWLKFCNQLVNPQLSLQSVNLQKLAEEFRPSQLRAKAGIIVAGIAGLCVLGGGIYFTAWAIKRSGEQRRVQQEQNFAASLHDSQGAYDRKDYAGALRSAQAALAIKPGEPEATRLRDAARTELAEQTYQTAMTEAKAALTQQDFSNVLAKVQVALDAKPDDPAAVKLKTEAQSQISADMARAEIRAAVAAAGAAEVAGNWSNAATQWQKAQQTGAPEPDARAGLLFANGLLSAQEKLSSAEAQSSSGPAQARVATNLCAQALATLPPGTSWSGNQARSAAVTSFTNRVASVWQKADRIIRDAAMSAAQVEQEYEKATNASWAAFGRQDYREATNQAAAALVLKPNDPAALKLRNQAQDAAQAFMLEAQTRERTYEGATNAALAALTRLDYREATNQAAIALSAHPGDAAAQKILNDAQQGAVQRQNNYEGATNAAGVALARGQFGEATNQTARALDLRPGDRVAMALRDTALLQEKNYEIATNAAANAFALGDYSNALKHATAALMIKTNDALALKLQSAAQAKAEDLAHMAREQELKYEAATNAAGKALAKNDYEGATNQANIALSIKLNDQSALQIRQEAERRAQQAMLTARQTQQQYESATNAAGSALTKADYSEANRQASLALDLRKNDPIAIQLKSRATQGLDLASATESFRTANYQAASDTCRRYPTNPEFVQLAGNIKVEQDSLADNTRKLNNADYTFISALQVQSYSSKRPFADLISQGNEERELLSTLQQLKQATNWQELTVRLAQAGSLTNKAPFGDLATWANQQLVEQQRIQVAGLANLDRQFDDFLRKFSVSWRGSKPLTGKGKAQPLPLVDLDQPFLDTQLAAVRTLRRDYSGHKWLDPDRESAFNNLEKKIQNWNNH
jgi:hypothetical protein